MNEQFLRQQLAITEQQRNAAMSAAAQASAAVDLANTTIKRLQERIATLEKAAEPKPVPNAIEAEPAHVLQ